MRTRWRGGARAVKRCVLVVVVAGAAVQCEPRAAPFAAVFWGDELVESEDLAPILDVFDWQQGAVVAADLDGDGLDDLIYYSRSREPSEANRTVAVRFAPDFEVVETPFPDERIEDYAAGDLDRDGRDDLLVARNGDLELLNHGPDGWDVIDSTQTSLPLWRPALGDMDGNGFLDVVARSGRDGPLLAVVPTDHTGGLGTGMIEVPFEPHGDRRPFVQDFDGDGLDDVLVDGTVVFGDGHHRYEAVEVPPEAVAGVDVDDDGDLDLVTVRDVLQVSNQIEGRVFGELREVGTWHGNTFEVVLVDVVNFDGGAVELLVLAYDYYDDRAVVLAGDGEGGLAIAREIDLPETSDSSGYGLLPGEFDGDDNIDLLYTWEKAYWPGCW